MEKRIEITPRKAGAVEAHLVQQKNATIPIEDAARIKVTAARSELAEMVREGDDLILRFVDGTTVRLDRYFNCPAETIPEVVFVEPGEGGQWRAALSERSCHLPTDSSVEALGYSFEPLSSGAAAGGGISGGLLAGLGALLVGGGVAAAAGGGGGGGGPNPGGPPVDTTPPAAPTVAPTNGRELTGTAEAGATIRIDVNGDGSVDGTTTANASGNWTFTPATPLANGVTVRVTAADAAGNVSPPTTVTVDAAAPAAPVINPTNGSVIAGTAEAGATVRLDLNNDGTVDATVTANGTGNWTYTPATPVANGTTVTATATDAVGNVSPPGSVVVDRLAPPAPTINPSRGDVLTGTAEAGATVRLDLDGDGDVDATATANGSGNWSYTPASPIPNNTTVIATAADAVGNVSPPASIVIDSLAPAVPTIGDIADNVGSVLGSVSNGGVTDDTTPTLSGTGAEANATITIYNNGTAIGTTTADGAGAWSFTPAALPPGAHSFTVSATDAAGNASAQSAAYAITIDTSAPPVPLIDSIVDNVGPILGTVLTGGTTDDTLPTLNGSGAEANATITIYDNGVAIGTTTADGAGNWSFTPASSLASIAHSFTVSSTDAAGNSSVQSAAYTITIDAIPPAAPAITSVTDNIGSVIGTVANGGFTDDTIPVLAGTGAEPNGLVRIFDNGVLIGTTTANGAGAWSFTPGAPLTEASHSFTVTTRDAVGNESLPSAAHVITVDLTAPTATIAITGISDDTGALGDWQTDDTSPTISGTLSAALGASERVEISLDGGATWAQATVSGTTWFHGPGTIGLGAHNISVRVIDAAGNIGNSANQAITVTNVNVGPIVQATSASLLGLISAEALGLLDLSGQSLVAVDPDGNLSSVVVRYAPLLALNLGAYTLTGSAQLAAELGLQVNIVNDPGVLGLIAPTSTMTITKLGGGAIDNLAINEFLKSVHFNQDLTLVGLQVLGSTTITGTDTDGVSSTSAVGTLLDLSLINMNGNPTLIEGDVSANTLNGSALNERIYGYGGSDILHGGGGTDLIRGGAGADEIYGDGGNDVLIFDAADVIIDGGTGTDILLMDSGTGLVATIDAATNIRNIESIHLGSGDGGRSIAIDEAGVLAATDSNRQLIVTGESNDSVSLTGAVYQGQTLINGHAYNQYVLGSVTVIVEDAVVVTVI